MALKVFVSSLWTCSCEVWLNASLNIFSGPSRLYSCFRYNKQSVSINERILTNKKELNLFEWTISDSDSCQHEMILALQCRLAICNIRIMINKLSSDNCALMLCIINYILSFCSNQSEILPWGISQIGNLKMSPSIVLNITCSHSTNHDRFF